MDETRDLGGSGPRARHRGEVVLEPAQRGIEPVGGLRLEQAAEALDRIELGAVVTFQDQFNGLDGFTGETYENPPRNSITYTDLSTGVFWSTSPEKRTQYHAGVGLYHVNRPSVALWQGKVDAPLGLRTVVIVGAQFETSPRTDLIPRLVFMTQSGNWEANIGANLRIGLDDYNDNSIYVGSWLRPVSDQSGKVSTDAVVVMTGVQLDKVRVGASYDINISPLVSASKTVGAFEVTLQFIGNYGEDKVMCPTF